MQFTELPWPEVFLFSFFSFFLRMPTITVDKAALLEGLGLSMSDEDVGELCFQFGIELDEVVPGEEVAYKIDIPANRYDLLCTTGLLSALKCFLTRQHPLLPAIHPPTTLLTKELPVPVKRKYISAAIIKNANLTEQSYKDLIEFQDKLHLSLGQNRRLVAMGTHDYDKTVPPYSYSCRPLDSIKFTPLNQARECLASELPSLYRNDPKLRTYATYSNSPDGHPVLCDSTGTVLSLPPVINSEHSKLQPGTKNILLEVTGTDIVRVETALSLVVAHFGKNARVEAVKIVEGGEEKKTRAEMVERRLRVTSQDVEKELRLKISADEAKGHLERMMHTADIETCSGDKWALSVRSSCLRSDVLHLFDLIEDIAISHGYNNFERTIPQFYTAGKENSLNKHTDALRQECALVGFTEVFTMALISAEENSLYGRISTPAIALKNPKSMECEVVRTSMLASLLKCIFSNQHYPPPIKIFEVSDVCLTDRSSDTGARNSRRLCMAVAGRSSSLEDLQESFDVVLARMGVCGVSYLEEAHPAFLLGRSCAVHLKNTTIGHLGVLDPEVTVQAKVPFVCSAVEIDLDLLTMLTLRSPLC